MRRRTVPPAVITSIETLVFYLWNDHEEERHWLENGKPDAHIFTHVKRVADWLGDYAADEA